MPRRTKIVALVIAVTAALLGACSTSGGNTRTIQVDARSDDFAGTFRAFFPRDVTVKPGMTLKFHQTWSGEPHTVTMGTAVQDLIEPEMLPLVRQSITRGVDDSNLPDAVNQAAGKFFATVPFFYGEKGINQAAAQPCFLNSGLPKGETACPKIAQPAFTGKQSYFNSGFIPYLGSRGNEFTMKIADNATPGVYFYYCTLHGPDMSGQITITKSGAVPSQAALNRQGLKEKLAINRLLLVPLDKEKSGKGDFKGNLAGSGDQKTLNGVKGQVNEFSPRIVKAKVGDPVTWTFIGNHTISFNVPPYVPYYSVKKDGTVVESRPISEPAGGWPGRSVPTPQNGPPIPNEQVNAGKFDGSGGLRSSGVDWEAGDTYTVTFTKAGTYPMACLVHPGMIGKVVVS